MNSILVELNFRNWHLWLLCLFIPTLLMLPVLIWPHYGLFSDAGQLIELPRQVLAGFPDTLKLLKPIENGRWNPLFHGLSIAIFALVPDSAMAFYVLQWVLFVAVCLSIVWVISRVTANKSLALFGLALFCTASSIFESFYTLDKVEPRVVFFTALFIASFLPTLSFHNHQHRQAKNWFYIVVQIISGIGIVFSKETGVFLAAALCLMWVSLSCSKSLNSELRRIVLRTALIQLAIVIIYVGLFKLLSPPMSYRYVSYDVSLTLILENITYYLRTSPELALGLVFASYWCLALVFPELSRSDRSGVERLMLSFLSLALFIYFFGICLWRWPLDYYLLPAHLLTAMLIPITLWAWSPVINKVNKKLLRVLVAGAGVVWLVYFAYRIFFGITIFYFDAVKDDLVHFMSSPSLIGKRVVLPFTHPQSFEVGERLKFFIDREHVLNNKIELYNFWEPPFLNRQNLHRFDNSAGMVPDKEQLDEIAKNPEKFVVWNFGYHKEGWWSEYLKAGDVILVPVGSKVLNKVNARGVSMHAKSPSDFLDSTPLELENIGQVRRHFASLWLGWELFEVKSIDVASNSGGYSKHILKVLNTKSDILPAKSTEALFDKNELPENSVFLGSGWFGVEHHQHRHFRWAGNQSEIVLGRLPEGHCSLSMRLEPLLDAQSKPLRLNWSLGLNNGSSILTTEQSVQFNFDSSGKSLQILKLYAEGGMERSPVNDPRLLKMRVFNIDAPSCSKTN